VKRTDLEHKLRRAASAAGLSMRVEPGKRHDKLMIGEITVTVPRHREINEYTAAAILKSFERLFGEGWWR
jgi:hypothetical protein